MSEGQTLVQNPEDDSCAAGSSCRSSIVKYSDESFATYTGENEESHQSYSQSFESYQSFDEDFEPESEISELKSELKSTSPQNFKKEIKEEYACCEDSGGLLAREKLIEKHLGVLNNDRFVPTPHHQKEKYTAFHRAVNLAEQWWQQGLELDIKCEAVGIIQQQTCGLGQTEHDPIHQEAIQTLQVESAPVQKYCRMKIDQIQRQLQLKQSERNKNGSQQLNRPLGRETAPQQNCRVPQHLINRVRLKYITETVKQVVQTNMHQPSRCAACLRKISEVAEHNFLRIKKIQLEEASIQEKIEEHIYTKDALTLIGEILNSLPKYSDAASLVWKRLFDKIILK